MLLGIFWGFFVVSLLGIARFGYVAATTSDGLQKGRARLIAGWAFCSWFIVLPILWSVYEAHLQVFEFQGTITSVDVRNHQSSHYSADLQIATTLGGTIAVHVSDDTRFWRTGQHLRVRYYGDSGELLNAIFLDSAGRQEGEVNRSAVFGRAFSIIIGILIAAAVWVRYRRDPEGRIEDTRDSSNIFDAVDQESILHLSNERSD